MNPLFGLGQALMLTLDPEHAHALTIKSLEMGIYPRSSAPDDARLSQTFLGLNFTNPIGVAPGFDKDARWPTGLENFSPKSSDSRRGSSTR